MNIIHQRTLSRRTLLRGVGVGMGLPWLEAMSPRALLGAPANPKPPQRAVVMFAPNGMYMPEWTPTGAGELKTVTPLLEPLEKHRRDFSVLSGLANMAVERTNERAKHALSATSFLTCVPPHKTLGNDLRAGVSFDQALAPHVQGDARFASLELSVETPTSTGPCDVGHHCAYSASISWRTPTVPAAREISPRAVFEMLFGDPKADRKNVARERGSILDFVQEDAKALERDLGKADRAKLDEYFVGVRELERRLQGYEKAPVADAALTASGPLPIAPPTFGEHAKFMIDLLVAALATDSTRVASLMLGNEQSNRNFAEIGIRSEHHGVSHHGDQPGKIQPYTAICKYLVTFFGHLLEKMKARREGEGTLLDNSVVLFGGGIGDGNTHKFYDLPILLAGGGNGTLRHGRHVAYPKETPLANLYLTLLGQFGVKQPRFADSTGQLPEWK